MKRGVAAFSLVEVVLALGVIGFALVAIIGLFPTALHSERASIQETRANHLAEQVFSTLRSQPFTAADLSLLGGNSVVDLSTENTESGAQGTLLYATYEGTFISAKDYFTVELKFHNAPDGLTPATANEVHLRIVSRDSGAQPFNYATIIAAQ